MINGVPRILIVRLSAIGDVVRVLPALHSLRTALPNAQIDWVVEDKAVDVLSGHSEIDRVIEFQRGAGGRASTARFMALCKEIRAARYEVVFDFHGILKSGAITRLSGATDRYGFAPPRAQEASHLALNHALKLDSPNLGRVEENLRLVEMLAPRTNEPGHSLFVPPDVADHVDQYFDSTFDAGKRVVAVHAPMDRDEKRWPAKRFAELCDMLLSDGRFQVVLTWGPGQEKAVEEVARLSRRGVMITPHFDTLKHYIHFIELADLYVGGDTGPMHIADEVGTPVVAIFGGTDPRKHAPDRRPHEVIEGTGNTAAEKLESISAETVYDACVRIIFGTPIGGPTK